MAKTLLLVGAVLPIFSFTALAEDAKDAQCKCTCVYETKAYSSGSVIKMSDGTIRSCHDDGVWK